MHAKKTQCRGYNQLLAPPITEKIQPTGYNLFSENQSKVAKLLGCWPFCIKHGTACGNLFENYVED